MLGELRALVDVAADVVGHRPDQQAEDEGDAPAPGGQSARHVSVAGEHGAEAGREQGGQALAGDLPAGEESAAPGRVLGQKGGGAAELTPGGEALEHACDHEHQRCASKPDAGCTWARPQISRVPDEHQHDGEA
jgi:hypothetical protein